MLNKFIRIVLPVIIAIFCIAGVMGCNQTAIPAASIPAASPKPTPSTPASATRTVTDMIGRTVELPAEIHSIVSTYPWGSWALYALGSQDLLVGVDSQSVKFIQFDRLEPEYKELPTVGFLNEINSEQILKLNPDFVLCGETEATQIENLGIPAVVIDPINDCVGSTLVTGKAIGKEQLAEELVTFYEDTIKIATDRTSSIPDDQKQKIFFVHMDKFTTIGNQAYIIKNVGCAGGISVTSDLPGSYPKIETEQLLDWDPDVVLVINGPLKEKSVTVADIMSDPSFQGITAVKQLRVYEEGTYYIYWLHPTIGACLGVLQMAKAMYPDKFEDISVTEKANEFCTRFFGRSYPGDAGGVDSIIKP